MTPEDLLTRTLHEVVETTEYPTTSMATVAARSRRVGHGRRRTTALVAAAAAVLIVGGSAVVWLDHDSASNPGPSGRLNPAGSLPDIPRGDAPQDAFLEGDTFVTAAGDRITSPAFRTASTATEVGDGVLVAGPVKSGKPYAAISLVSGGSTSPIGCGTPSFALGDDDPTYWLSEGCRLVGPGRLVHGTTSTDTAIGTILDPIRVTSAGLVANINALSKRPIPHVDSGRSGPFVTDAGGASHRIPHLNGVTAASPSGDLATGVTSFGTSVVVESSTGSVQWRAAPGCFLGHFSASGRYVVGLQKVGQQTAEGVGDVVGIWDATTGRQVVRAVLPNLSIVSNAAWEGDGSVLVVAEDRHQQQAIVRVTLDGSITRATSVAASGEGTFRLAATP